MEYMTTTLNCVLIKLSESPLFPVVDCDMCAQTNRVCVYTGRSPLLCCWLWRARKHAHARTDTLTWATRVNTYLHRPDAIKHCCCANLKLKYFFSMKTEACDISVTEDVCDQKIRVTLQSTETGDMPMITELHDMSIRYLNMSVNANILGF